MLVDFLIISLLVALFRGGRIKGLVDMPLKNTALIFLSFIIRYLPLILNGSTLKLVIDHNLAIVTISYILLLYALVKNWHIKGMNIVTFGVFLNLLVIAANGGKMPVSLWAIEVTQLESLKPLLFDVEYLYHKALDNTTKLSFLADVIPLPPPYPKPKVFSLGDLAMGVGMFFIIQKYMKVSSKKY